ncbi:MAG TPA: alpha/beta hydrolase [Alphaproteobacteria bacterium]
MIAATLANAAPKLDPREEHFRIPSPLSGLELFLRHLPPSLETPPLGKSVLYVHGGTFPSALSVAHPFDGRSWRDELCAAGFDVWALDFHGFGRLSDPYPEMAHPAEGLAPLGRAEEASRQLEQALRFISARQGCGRISLIAHSWGTMVAGRLAGRAPDLVDRLVFFGPIARRTEAALPAAGRVRLPGWRLISLRDQWDRFVADVPPGEAPVLLKRHFERWGECYLDVDPASRSRVPAAVKVPSGAFQDIFDAWAGELAYDPGRIRAPVAIIRGEWDGMCTDADARWLFDALSSAPIRRDVKIARATHLMHLESARYALYRETEAFLAAGDLAPAA